MSQFNRRRFLVASTSGALALSPLSYLLAQDEEGPKESGGSREQSSSDMMTPRVHSAVEKGLAYLAKRQIQSGRDKGCFGTSGYSGGVAVGGLGGLAFMCGGSPPGQGQYGKHVDRCADFICANQDKNGFITVSNGGGSRDSMYGHGFATLFLAEAYGMSSRPDADSTIGDALRKSIKLFVECQNDAGGWRYEPRKSDADLSITICQIMALRAARDAGINVPDNTREKCIEYVKKSQNADGGFRYTLHSGGGSTFPLTAAGICSLYSAGIYDGEAIDKGLKYLMNYLPGKGGSSGYYFYGHYYACQAMWHAGGSHWTKWYTAIRDELLRKQAGDGSWTDDQAGIEFGTAMACIILQMPNNYLPVFSP
jgi:hypothetical protein